MSNLTPKDVVEISDVLFLMIQNKSNQCGQVLLEHRNEGKVHINDEQIREAIGFCAKVLLNFNNDIYEIERRRALEMRESLTIPELTKAVLDSPTFRSHNFEGEVMTNLKVEFEKIGKKRGYEYNDEMINILSKMEIITAHKANQVARDLIFQYSVSENAMPN